jgi:hypothetical protein
MFFNYFRTWLILGAVMGCTACTQVVSAPQSSMDKALYGVGYAVIDVQEGASDDEKRMLAVKASKLDAYRALAEQLYGQYVEVTGQTTNGRLNDEVLRSRVEGVIYRAELISVKPLGTHTYETVLRLGSPSPAQIVETTWVERPVNNGDAQVVSKQTR